MSSALFITAATEVPAPGTISAGPIGGVFFAALAIASFLLWRNLNKRLRRMDERERELAERDSAE